MERLIVVAVLVVAAAAVAWVLRHCGVDAPTRGASWAVPTHLDRRDFIRPEAPWLVAVFSSTSCLSCQATWAKASHLASSVVAVEELEAEANHELHERYGVEAVPMVLVADGTGDVLASFLGEPTATDLWATLAELRAPGSVPGGCGHGLT